MTTYLCTNVFNRFSTKKVENVYCGIIRCLGGSIFVEFVGVSHQRINILHKLVN